MIQRNKKAQSILEYVILVSVVILGILLFVSWMSSNKDTSGIGKLIDGANQTILNASLKIKNMVP